MIEIIEVSKIISPSRFNEGGAAIFAADIKNHQRAIDGVSNSKPFLRYNLRLLEVSYVILARANRALLDKPWAIIITIAPSSPHFDKEYRPPIKMAMCPTEE